MRLAFIFFASFLLLQEHGQPKNKRPDTSQTKMIVDSINRALDHAVVQKRISFLEKHYADDFRFFHATGMIDSKKSWIDQVKGNLMRSREHDSTSVELHQDLAIVTGILTVRFPPQANRKDYAVRYIRVYAYRQNRWQLVSHHSTGEWEPGNP
jgi:ketosteroid isomerase-like protein